MVATLARASVDGAVLVAAVWVISRLLSLSPATRTVLWWCAAAKFVLALIWTTPIAIPVLPAPATVRVESTQPVRASASPASARRAAGVAPARQPTVAATTSRPGISSTFVSSLREWSLVAAFVWVLGLTLTALVGWRRWRETELMMSSSEPAPDALRLQAADLAARLQLRQVPDVRMSSRIETPLVTGLTRPVVLLPATRFPGLTEAQQQMALCHELAHVKRADLWLGCVPAFAERVFFFHPLVHLAAREYAVAREAACDAAVMRTLAASPQEYGRLLLTLGVSQPQASLTAAGAAWSFVNLKRRMIMLQDVSPRSTRSRVVAIAVVVLAVAALVPMQLAARPGAAQVAVRSPNLPRVDLAAQAAPAAPQAKPPAVNTTPANEPIERDTRQESPKRSSDFNFVLLPGGDRSSTYGSGADVARVRKMQKDNEPLLWFSDGEREYVVRDAGVVAQAHDLFSRIGRDDFDMSEVHDAIKSLDIDGIVAHSVKAAQVGEIAADIGAIAAEQALQVLAHLGDTLDFDHLELKDLDHKLDKASRDLEEKMRDFEHRFNHDLEGKMRELEHRLDSLDVPSKDMSEKFEKFGEEFGEKMEKFGRRVEDQAHKAADDMQKLIERSIADGRAQRVR